MGCRVRLQCGSCTQKSSEGMRVFPTTVPDAKQFLHKLISYFWTSEFGRKVNAGKFAYCAMGLCKPHWVLQSPVNSRL